jgi:polyphosphate:AMP phosphotransferase
LSTLEFDGTRDSDLRGKALEMTVSKNISAGARKADEKLSKADFKARVAELRVALVNAQYQLHQADFSVIILLAGTDRMGGEQLIDRLHEWMDGRFLDTWFAGKPTDAELSRPRFWRFWRAMPPKGRIGIFVGGWMTEILTEVVQGKVGEEELSNRFDHFNALDRMLKDDGTLCLKLWVEIPQKALKKRLKKLDTGHALYVEDLDHLILEHYDVAKGAIDRIMNDAARHVPWTVLDGQDERNRDLTAAETILRALNHRLDNPPNPPVPREDHPVRDHLAGVDLGRTIDYDDYRKELEALQLRMHKLSLKMRERELGVVMAFEGWDAAGKGGVIRRITQAVSARDCKVIPVAAPTDEELSHHYLWRFWRHLPRDGQMRIFDRSWYGRVLVERVERLARPDEWQRAYEEINDFEAQIVEHGHLMLKFWLHIDADEQLRRFKAREVTPYKKYKITDEDYRNREKWPLYESAVNEMVERTSRSFAPWHLVAANDKRSARVEVLGIVCDALEQALKKKKRK